MYLLKYSQLTCKDEEAACIADNNFIDCLDTIIIRLLKMMQPGLNKKIRLQEGWRRTQMGETT